jgi:hypothetical protein
MKNPSEDRDLEKIGFFMEIAILISFTEPPMGAKGKEKFLPKERRFHYTRGCCAVGACYFLLEGLVWTCG